MKSAATGRKAWILATLGIVSAAICLRFALNFRTPFPPSTDAGYYPMQTLYWFANGRLMYDDLPLLFWLNIALTKFLTILGQPLDAAALLASRVLDCVLQPFTAVAVMIAGYTWSEGRRKGIVGSVIAALLVTASPLILRFLSDFQKNSLGFVWMAAAIWLCRSVMVEPTRRRWIALGCVMVLSALTHVGAFGVTALAVALPLLIWGVQRRGQSIVLTLGAGAVVGMIVLFIFDSRRALLLARSPIAVFLTGPFGFEFPGLPLIILTLLAVVLAIRRWRLDRNELPSSDMAFITGLAVTLVLLVLPKNQEYFGRLLMMSQIPATFLILFVLARRAAIGRSLIPAFVVLGFVVVPFVAGDSPLQPVMMTEQAAAELRQFRQQIADKKIDPKRTLLVAPHGLEWWSGYFLGTPVRMLKPATSDSRYDRVLLLRNIAPIGGLPGPVKPQTLGPTVRRIYRGDALEVYEVLQGDAARMETWNGSVELAPGKAVMFKAEFDLLAAPPVGYFVVGNERLPIPEISVNGTSLHLNFSEYGAEMRGVLDGKTWSGEYLRHRAAGTKSFRFSATAGAASSDPSETLMPLGTFKVKFDDEKPSEAKTTAKFWKAGDAVLGTFIAPDGDYGLLEGVAPGDGRMEFHRFTGWQATRIDLRQRDNKWIGVFLAASNDKPRGFTLQASVDTAAVPQTRMKNPAATFEFACASPTGQMVRNADFKGKPLVVDIMGTWCHNCLDSAPVLQQLQSRYERKGLQVVGLSFEIRDDAKLAEKNLNLFKERFGLTYPVLFCGDLDEGNVDRRLKSQIDDFFAFPTTLFIDRSGRVQTIHSGFKGPGTGEEFEPEVAAFHELANRLVLETR